MTTYWQYGADGAFEDPDNWSGGVPAAHLDAGIIAAGNYTVTLSSAQSVSRLVMEGAGAKLVETDAGSLNLANGLLVAYGATLVLNGANSAGDSDFTFDIEDAQLVVGSDGALGTNQLDLYNGSTLSNDRDVTISNPVFVGDPTTGAQADATLAAAHGTTLTLSGSLNIAPDSGTLYIGDRTSNGTVVLPQIWVNPPDQDAPEVYRSVVLRGGTTLIGADSSFSFTYFGGSAPGVTNTLAVESGAVLDLNGNLTTISGLQTNTGSATEPAGDGVITNSGAIATLQLLGGSFSGVLSGPINLDAYSAELAGAVEISGHIFAENLTLDGSGVISCSIQASGLYVRGQLGGPGLTLAGLITGSQLTQDGYQPLTLSHDNTVTNFATYGSTTTISSGAALGSGTVELDGGTIISTRAAALTQDIVLQGAAGLVEASGKVLTLSGTLTANAQPVLTLGMAGDAGAVVDSLSAVTANAAYAVELAYGALRVGAGAAGLLTSRASWLTLDAGTTFDLEGQAATAVRLSGAGTITSSGKATGALTIDGGVFSGVIGGKLQVEIGYGADTGDYGGAVILTAGETYTAGTTIDAFFTLQLGAGGATGSVKGAITDNGTLALDHSGASTISNAISGSGGLLMRGTGTETLTGANTFTGGVTVKSGELVVSDASRLGSGDVTLKGGILAFADGPQLGSGAVRFLGGEILSTATTSLGGSFDIGISGDIAAAAAAVLTVTADQHVNAATTALHFGSASAGGVIDLAPANIQVDSTTFAIDIDGGTLVVANDLAGGMFDNTGAVAVAAGAVLDIDNQPLFLTTLTGAGEVTTSGGGGALYFGDSLFSGEIDGPLTVVASGAVSLLGQGAFARLQISAGASVTLGAAASETVAFTGQNEALVLTKTAALSGHITGFGTGDSIDVGAVAFGHGTKASFKADKDKLVVSDGTHSVTLTLDGTYTQSDFKIANDHHGGTLVTFAGAAAAPEADVSALDAILHHHHDSHADLVV